MSFDIMLPLVRRGQKYGMVKLVEWKAKEGDWVDKGNTILVIESEKASHEIEAEASGFLNILVEEGQKAMVGTKVGVITESREELEGLQESARQPSR